MNMVTPKDCPALVYRWRKLRDEYGWTPKKIAKEFGASYRSVLYWLGSSKTLSASVEDSRMKSRYFYKYEENLRNHIPTVFEPGEEISLSDINSKFYRNYGIRPKESTLKRYISQFIETDPRFPIEETAPGSCIYRQKRNNKQTSFL